MGSRSRKNPLFNDRTLTDLHKGIGKDGTPFVRASVITTPIKAKEKERHVSDCDSDNISRDETPIKNLLQMKRRSLMCDMNWSEDNTEENSIKHPMEMRSRKRSKLKEYYDYQEYDDFAEDLSFLFEEEIPDPECPPRRKPRKKRSSISMKGDLKVLLKSDHSLSSTSSIKKDANDPTSSLFETSLFAKSNLKSASPSDLKICNNKSMTSSRRSSGTPCFPDSNANSKTVFHSNHDTCRKNDSHGEKIQPQKRKNSSTIEDNSAKWQKSEIPSRHLIKTTKGNISDKKIAPKIGKILTLSCDTDCGRKSQLKLNCAAKKLGARNVPTMPNPTVIKMTLRRRHSTPSLGGRLFNEENREKMERTVSIPAGTGGDVPTKKVRKYQKLDSRDSSVEWTDYSDDISDSEQFVDSPESTDSGFSSETSYSAPTPDAESRNSLNFDPAKTNQEPRICVSQTSSKDARLHESANKESKIAASNEPQDGELRLVLCQKSIQEAQRLETEAKKRKEEEELREKYQCMWVDCPDPFESRSGAELHSHLEKFHAENYCCRWKSCKFFEIKSRKLTFLQRHIGEHSGEKPYKCILDGCDASFSSLPSRKRHVEAHYSEVSYPKAKVGGENGFPRHLLNSRRIKDKRKTLANRHDCMDNHTLAFIRHALIQNQVTLATDDDDVINNPSDITFRPEAVSKEATKDGEKVFQGKGKVENMLSNERILQTERTEGKEMKKAELPRNGNTALRRLFFFGRNSSGRKTTNKPSTLLETLF